MADLESSLLDIRRFDDRGEELSWSRFRVSPYSQRAPFKIHGRFDKGQEIWCHLLVYADGVTLIEATRPPDMDQQSGNLMHHKKAFLLYPSKEAARTAGWDV